MRRRRAWSVGASLGVVLALVLAPRASAASFIYWADPGEHAISRADLDGSHVIRQFLKGVQFPCGVAVVDGHIYWANLWNARRNGPGTTIGRANLNGTGVDNSFIAGADWPCGLTVAGSRLYWADGPSQNPGFQPDRDGTIGAANLDGSAVMQSVVNIAASASSLGFPNAAVLQGALSSTAGKLLWGDWGNDTIGAASLDGTSASDDLITLATNTDPEGLTVSGDQLYWAGSAGSRGLIGRANLDGTEVDPQLVQTSQGGICGLAASGTALYWTWVNSTTLNGGIGRVGLDGQGVDQFLTGHGLGVGCGIAVGAGARVLSPPRVRITRERVSSTEHQVRFSFKAVGKASGFQCSLRRAGAQPRFKRCRSPKSYAHLVGGRYTFRVRAVRAGGAGPAISRRFTI